MPQLAPDQIFKSNEPDLLVENRLKEGLYLFRLVVIDDSGNESKPAELQVRVVPPPTRNPTIPTDRIVVDRLRVPIRDTVVTPAPAPKPPPPPVVAPTRVTPIRRTTPITPVRPKPPR